MGVRKQLWILVLAAPGLVMLAGCAAGNGGGSPTPLPSSPPVTASNEWTWVSGANVVNQAGSYGTLGTAAASNVPGARGGSVSWTDAAGNLWLFGGAGPSVGGGCNQFDALCWAGTNEWYDDLWEFSGGEWTWVGGPSATDQAGVYGKLGVAAAENAPGARYGGVSWTDQAGNFWLFGGTGYDSTGAVGLLNDLWKYSGGLWTWMGGAKVINQNGTYGTLRTASAGNMPGARATAVSFVDKAGNLWLFGGQGCDSVAGECGPVLNDLWEYSGGEWAWMGGEEVSYPAQPGVYGTEGVASASNQVGARYSASAWSDPSGNLWVFGGVGYGTWDYNVGGLNDLWKYSGGEWTWMSGQKSSPNVYGTYGTEGMAAAGNTPGTRSSGMSWTDAQGNLWFFGGSGFGMNVGSSYFNDLWKYSAGEWTWMGGTGAAAQVGTYGTEGMAAAANDPGGRIEAVTWTDAQGNLWMFGGEGVDSKGQTGELNDLWEYQP